MQKPTVEAIDMMCLTPEDGLSLAVLSHATWPPKDPATKIEPIRAWQRYDGPAEQRPRVFCIRDGDRIVAKADTFPREIELPTGRVVILALAGVCTLTEMRGRGLGAAVVRAAFDLVNQGAFPFCLLQTGVPGFYEKLGAKIVKNNFVNSLAADPKAPVFWDAAVMAYPGTIAIPPGQIDLRGPAY